MKKRILFQRHGEHKSQILVPEDRERCIETGRQLAKAGVKIDRMVLSPLPRAIATALATCEGYGSADIPLKLEPRMGDFKSDPRTPKAAVKALKATSKERYGDDSDANLAKCLIDTPDLHELLFLRAQEGAMALADMAMEHPGIDEMILVVSHGVARMEISIRYLQGKRGVDLLQIADELIDRGQIIELTFEDGFEGVGTEFISAKPWTPPIHEPPCRCL